MQIGVYTFAETTPDARTGETVSAAQRLRDLMEEIELADQVGLDVFGVGEHHRPEYAVSAPAVVLAAAAERTRGIRLTSAVTVLSSDDPVRVFQRFSTLNAASNGRAEIILGRGSFVESFPHFGYPLEQYETLFEEKLELFVGLLEADRTGTPASWKGTQRAPITGLRVFPATEQGSLTTWIGVGGSPESVARAAHYGLPLMLAIIGGESHRFAPYVALHASLVLGEPCCATVDAVGALG
jgi:alkanesulfonate monooxygenase SsuD/methylene tetrahydromethanopterin reductase-like flavin-dependent oxidoreductase (luciferase family)